MTPRGTQITTLVQTAIQTAISRMNVYYAPIITAWPAMTRDQRASYLAHSPILSALIGFTNQFRGADDR